MIRMNAPRLDHLRRLTDSKGLMHAAMGDCPDRFSGYRTVDNADALRLCAQASDAVQGERIVPLAVIYFDFLWRARREDGRVHHLCDDHGQWISGDGDALVQSRLARALAAVIVSELPIALRLKAADWWRELLQSAADAQCPQSAAHWLIAMSHLREADPGRDLGCAGRLARWLVEDCYYSIRTPGWEWFESHWSPGAACVAEGLWCAARLLDEPQYLVVAETVTNFLVAQCFEEDVLVPPGTQGAWSAGVRKSAGDQLPEDVAAIASLFDTAEHINGSPVYGRHAELAARWFVGHNRQAQSMIDPATGACRDALSSNGASDDRGGSAAVAYLLTESLRAARAVRAAEPPVYLVPING